MQCLDGSYSHLQTVLGQNINWLLEVLTISSHIVRKVNKVIRHCLLNSVGVLWGDVGGTNIGWQGCKATMLVRAVRPSSQSCASNSNSSPGRRLSINMIKHLGNLFLSLLSQISTYIIAAHTLSDRMMASATGLARLVTEWHVWLLWCLVREWKTRPNGWRRGPQEKVTRVSPILSSLAGQKETGRWAPHGLN